MSIVSPRSAWKDPESGFGLSQKAHLFKRMLDHPHSLRLRVTAGKFSVQQSSTWLTELATTEEQPFS